MQKSKFHYVFCFVLAASFIQNTNVSAQSVWQGEFEKPSISIEYFNPDLVIEHYSTWSSAGFVQGQYSVANNLVFVGELSFAHGRLEGFSVPDNDETGWIEENTFGNPYLGLQLWREMGYLEFGFRPPVVTDVDLNIARFIGANVDLQRNEAFLDNNLILAFKVKPIRKINSQWNVDFQIAPRVWIPTGDEGYDTQFRIQYGSQVNLNMEPVTLSLALDGRMNVSGRLRDVSDVFVNQVGFLGSFALGNFYPGFQFKMPVDSELESFLNYVVGFSVTYRP